ncbi:MAG: NADH-quinone oxidoreductase subunit L [Candidatus Dormibacteraceae bacterium]
MPLQLFAGLVLALPAAGALVLAPFGRVLPRGAVKVIGPGVVWVAFVCAVLLLVDSAQNAGAHSFTYWTWLHVGTFSVPFDLYVDRLSIFMALVVSGVSGLIVTYSIGYVGHEDGASFARFFCFMDVFVLSMLLLVLAGNLVFLIVGWAGVGLSSYLLIGFWYWRHAAVAAARKAFIMNVIGDAAMILAVFTIWVNTHAITYQGLFAAVPKMDQPWLEVTCFLLLVAGVAKSAQLPLHTWLPDAMEGPTPVSALIHAATMVTAGVYLVARMHLLYDVAIYAHDTVAIVGGATAIFAATIAVVQTDIKKVLAYSTMSQVGYMVMAVGLSEYSAGLFHLMAHAFFKALLFMAAGNIIHVMADEQDMRKFGGLFRQLPLTSICFLVGALSLSGIIPFVGFWSKDMILGEAFGKATALPVVMWAVGTFTAILTAFYTGRMWWIGFMGRPSAERPVEHPHEAPPVMLVTVVILAVLACVGGFIQVSALFGTSGPQVITNFLKPVVGTISWSDSPVGVPITIATVILAAIAFLIPYFFYVAPRPWPTWSRALPFAQTFLDHKYYADELYDALFVRTTDGLAKGGDEVVEIPLIDGAATAIGEVAGGSGGRLSLLQSGYFRSYMVVFVIGAVIAVLIMLTRI